MMSHGHATVRSYTIGFMLSIVLTLIPYLIVTEGLLSGWALLVSLVISAIAQLIVQLLFFLHIDASKANRWQLVAFLFAVLVVVILVVGTLWIMDNLDYRMMPQEMEQEILKDEVFKK